VLKICAEVIAPNHSHREHAVKEKDITVEKEELATLAALNSLQIGL
jgi:hypothetical protein